MTAASRRHQVSERIQTERVSAIIRTEDKSLASDAMQAAVDGGFRMVEFTLTTPGALELVAEYARKPGLLVGAGTVMSPALAREAVSAGASFLVSPICDPAVLAAAVALDVACIPGACTPTEMETAHRCGADFVKVFPEPAGGLDFIKAVRGPLPHLKLFPTAGPAPDNFIDFLEAGCAGVGFVRTLFDPDDLATGALSAIRERAAGIMRRLAEWRESDT